MRILIVEDESKVARALKQGLEREFCDVHVAATGRTEAVFRCTRQARLAVRSASRFRRSNVRRPNASSTGINCPSRSRQSGDQEGAADKLETFHHETIADPSPPGLPLSAPSVINLPAPPTPPNDPGGSTLPRTAAPPFPPLIDVHSVWPPM